MFIDLRDPRAKVGSDEEFPALDFGLDYYEGEVCFGVHVAGHLFDFFDLGFDAVCDAFD
jgi:hypothetical protein